MASGLPRGTRPPSVTSAIVAPSSVLTRRGAGLDGVDPAAVELDARILAVHASHRRDLQLGLHGGAQRAARDAIAAGQEGGAGDEEVRPRRGHEGDQLGNRAIRLLGGMVVAADHRRDDGARIAEGLLDGPCRADGAVEHLRSDAGLLLAAELAEELIEERDHAQRPGRHHRTSAITRVVPTCSIAPHSPPYVARVSPRSFAARSSAPTTRSTAGSVSGSWLLPTFTRESTPGRSKSSMPSALPSVDMSSTTAVVLTPSASHCEAAWAMST